MKHLKSSIIIFILAGVSACQKKDTTPAQADKITIDLTNPKDGQVYHKGDTVKMQAAVSYISELHAYEMSIKNKTTNEVVYDVYEHVHSDKINIDTWWVDSVSVATELKLELTVQIDHDGHETTKEITLHSQL
jgi:hypothetical protein